MEQKLIQKNSELEKPKEDEGFYIDLKPSVKQFQAYQILDDPEILALVYGGGAGGGKTWLACEWIVRQATNFPETKYFLAREKLKTLKMTTLVTLFKVCKHHGLKKGVHYGYNATMGIVEFWNGSTVDLLEVKLNPSDPMFEDLGSLEYTQGAIDEAGEVVFGAFDTLKSRVGRHLNDKYKIPPKILCTCNPKKNWLYTMFYKPTKEGNINPKYRFLPALVDDNPYIESNYKSQLQEIQDVVKRQRLLLGDWEYENDPHALIKYENIVDLFTNPVPARPDRYVIVDVARFGGDKIVFTLYHGLVVKSVVVMKKQALTKTAKDLREFLVKHEVPYSHCLIDEDGVGGGLVDMLEGTKGFRANSTPFDNPATGKPDNYASLKDQCGYKLAEYINAHKIRIELDDVQVLIEGEDEGAERFKELLIEELEQIKQLEVDADDKKKKLVPKGQIKEIIGRSPDYSDTLLMRMYFEFNDVDTEDDSWDDDTETAIEEPSSFDLLK